jgi:type VII secretion protein EssC, C-terminal domain
MATIFRIMQRDSFEEHELADISNFTVGSGKQDTIPLDFLGKSELRFEKGNHGVWSFRSAKPLLMQGATVTEGTLSREELLLLQGSGECAVTVFETDLNDFTVVDTSGQDKISVGRGKENQITISSRLVSGCHVVLERNTSGWKIADKSSNGTFLDSKRLSGDISCSEVTLDIGLSRLILQGDTLTVRSGVAVKDNIVREVLVKVAEKPEDEYPHLFKRSPRLLEDIVEHEVDFQIAPSIGSKPNINWLSVVMAPLSSVLVMVFVAFVLGGPKTTLLFSLPMAIVGLAMSLFNYRRQIKTHEKTEQLRLEKYNEYMCGKEQEIVKAQQSMRRILTQIHPETGECLPIVTKPARRLWERRVSDRDFMQLRIGKGEVKSMVSFRVPKQALALVKDELADRPQMLAEQYSAVADCPITHNLKTLPTCGLIGERSSCIQLAKNMVMQAATHHSYEDLNIVLICDKKEYPQWDFISWLPHHFDETRSERFLVDDSVSAKRVFTKIEEILSHRFSNEEIRRTGGMSTPYFLFICADMSLLERFSISGYLLSNYEEYNAGTILLNDELHLLPKECSTIIEMQRDKGVIYQRNNVGSKTAFVIDRLPSEYDIAFSRALAPIRIEPSSGKGVLPTSISFLQGFGVMRTNEFKVEELWENARPETSMAVPIGVRKNGEAFLFDIHEKQHGPHGLVAGMTGSGKSEMVQSWILSMALRFPPEAVSFVLIDFKGTGLILPFRNLPHLAGTISDLDTSIGRNLIALENELNRRKALLDENGVANISSYQKLYRQGKVSQPISYLFIVIDEFAEFKVQYPDFMQVINRVFAIGRTLGVHMILLTQKPTNVVDDKMSANTRFRWCLKVASSADSKEMIHHTDAARITNPGRAFVQVGEDEVFEEIQTYWSGAPYNPYRELSLQRSNKVFIVDRYGRKSSYEAEKTTGFRAEKNEIDAIVDYLDDVVRKNELPRAMSIWTGKLEAKLELSQVLQLAFDGEQWNEQENTLTPVVGMLDDPRSQSQYPMRINFEEDGHIVVYGAPGTGKTTFLHSLIMSLALSYPPDYISLYLMDFGGGSLNLFSKLPHVGGVVRDSEEERMEKLWKMIQSKLEDRKAKFLAAGVINYTSFMESSKETLPYVVLILDNFVPVLNLFPAMESFFQNLTREAASYGIYFVTTANATNTIPYRIAQNLKSGIALRMADKGDYSIIVGRTDGMEPENFPGRGLCKGRPPLEFQTAQPAQGVTEGQRVANIREVSTLMDIKWKGFRPAAIPFMPETVCSDDYHSDDLFVGLTYEKIAPVAFAPLNNQFLLISHNGKLNINQLSLLCKQTANKYECKTILSYGKQPLDDATEHLSTPNSFDLWIEALMPELQKRKNDLQIDSLNQQEHPLILIVIHDLEDCYQQATEKTVQRLGAIVTLGKGLNISLIVAGSNSGHSKYYHAGDILTNNLVAKSDALVYGSPLSDHGIFKTNLPFSAASESLADGDAYLVRDGIAEKIKLAKA